MSRELTGPGLRLNGRWASDAAYFGRLRFGTQWPGLGPREVLILPEEEGFVATEVRGNHPFIRESRRFNCISRSDCVGAGT